MDRLLEGEEDVGSSTSTQQWLRMGAIRENGKDKVKG